MSNTVNQNCIVEGRLTDRKLLHKTAVHQMGQLLSLKYGKTSAGLADIESEGPKERHQ